MKIDLCIVPTVALLYLFCFIDRANIGMEQDLWQLSFVDLQCVGNARLAGFEDDLALVGYDYNTVLSTFYISYIVFEIPSNIACKWVGPGWWIPSISLGFGLMTICFAFVNTLPEACGVRFL